MEIRDWWLACELDVAAATLLHVEELKRENEREERDREFWMQMLGGESSSVKQITAEELIAQRAM